MVLTCKKKMVLTCKEKMVLTCKEKNIEGYEGARMMNLVVEGKQKRGTSKLRWTDRIREDLKE